MKLSLGGNTGQLERKVGKQATLKDLIVRLDKDAPD